MARVRVLPEGIMSEDECYEKYELKHRINRIRGEIATEKANLGNPRGKCPVGESDRTGTKPTFIEKIFSFFSTPRKS